MRWLRRRTVVCAAVLGVSLATYFVAEWRTDPCRGKQNSMEAVQDQAGTVSFQPCDAAGADAEVIPVVRWSARAVLLSSAVFFGVCVVEGVLLWRARRRLSA